MLLAGVICLFLPPDWHEIRCKRLGAVAFRALKDLIVVSYWPNLCHNQWSEGQIGAPIVKGQA
jgi:hypothetical protein